MERLKEVLQKVSTQRFLLLAGLGLFFYISRSVFDLFLLTFIFTYLIYNLHAFFVKHLCKITPKTEKFEEINHLVVTIVIYLFMFTTIGIVIYQYLPLAVKQIPEITSYIEDFKTTETSNDIIGNFEKYLSFVEVSKDDIDGYKKKGLDIILKAATSASKWSFNIFLAMVLSMFFMLEKKKVLEFIRSLKKSKLGILYGHLSFFGYNFLNSFGKVMKAQIMIAIANTALSMLGLFIFGFPSIIALGFMIFILSLIPVAGVIISLIPLCLIAFKIGGLLMILKVLAMITIIHFIESYFLNPKFMADKTELPVFFTFLILIIGEHFMGIWGLLIGIPLFIFFLDILGGGKEDVENKKNEEKAEKKGTKKL